jgi:hypothetical protein
MNEGACIMQKRTKVIIAASIATLVSSVTLAGTSFANRRGPEERSGEYGHSTRHERFGPGEHHGRHDWQMRSERFLDSFDSHSDGKLTQAEVDRGPRDRLAQFDTDKDGQLILQEKQAYQALRLVLFLKLILQHKY